MNNLQLIHLKRFCKRHELDPQLIDSEISYAENKKYLSSLVAKPAEARLPEWEAQMDDYMKHHFLTFYVGCILDGSTKSEATGPPIQPPRFSLGEWIKRRG
jgi:hypothetical protein